MAKVNKQDATRAQLAKTNAKLAELTKRVAALERAK